MELMRFQLNFTARRVFILQDEKNSNINKEAIKQMLREKNRIWLNELWLKVAFKFFEYFRTSNFVLVF